MRTPEEELAALRDADLLRELQRVESASAPRLQIAGREYLSFASNDYLGLSHHPSLREAAREALDRFGTGATSSRLICGSLAVHHELEARIAELKQAEAALSFSTGYATAVGTLTSLLQKGDVVILDKLCHASLIDGARLSGATLRVYPHNNLKRLERLLATSRERAAPDSRILVVTESVFSMDGDRAPLAEIASLASRHEALLLVDEAHALGVIGPTGQGAAEELGLQKHIDFQMGTLGKAVGAAGGYVAARREWIDLLLNRARSFIYSTAPPPSQAAAALAGLNLIATSEGQALRTRLWGNIRDLTEALDLPEPTSAIQPIVIGDNRETLETAAALREAGLLVPAIRYPTVARNEARLRITLSAAHETGHLTKLAAALRACAKER